MKRFVDIIVVNWNSGDLVSRCAASILDRLSSNGSVGRIIIVDNASRDGSADGLTDEAGRITVIRNGRNAGFAAACNQGARGSAADYLLFLNPDTRVLDGSFDAAVAFMEHEDNQRIGILGLRLVDGDGRTQRSCARLPTLGRLVAQGTGADKLFPRLFPACPMAEWDHQETRDVDQVMGACLLIRRTLFEALGGFDERFFVYYDDVDLCARAKGLGYRVVHFTGAQVYHLGGGTTANAKARRLFYLLRSRMLYAGKHFGAVSACAAVLACLTLEPAVRLARAVARLSPRECADVLGATALLWADLPGYLPKMVRR